MKIVNLFMIKLSILLLFLINIFSIAKAQYDQYSAFSIVAGACFFWIIIWFVIFIIIAIWVYGDAEKRGKSGALWLIIVILLGLIGILIWLIVRPPIQSELKKVDEEMMNCQYCHRKIPLNSLFCAYCGEAFEEFTPIDEKELKESEKIENDEAMKVLKLRYAKGEITEEKYKKMKKELED